MTACLDCGQTHRTGLDGIRCDLEHHGETATRRNLRALGLTDTQIDDLLERAADPTPHTESHQFEGGVTVIGEPDSDRSTDPAGLGRHTPPSPGPAGDDTLGADT